MSVQNFLARTQTSLKEQPWPLYARQISVLVRNEVRRNLFTRRRIWVYFLSFVPVLFLLLRDIFSHGQSDAVYIEQQTQGLAILVQVYYLRLGVFFACMGIFTWLFRGEIVQRTLHYQFLAPVRREVLVVGKFLAGAIASILLFEFAVAACFYLTYSRFGSAGQAYMFGAPGLSQLGAYLLVTALACLGYGSVFLALSLVFKNPIIPGVIIMGWETISPVFPGWAQRLSVTFYLKQLCPVAIPADGPLAIFTVVAEPVSHFAAVFGLSCLALAIVVLSCFLIRRIEIMYTAE
jgi:ABC-type transport system involved in multi-copper enzyme maturation permease subunit